ncbi:MAG: glycoside hydrolase family 97 protein [Terriglobia bacterium]|jgi:alpha-glucosidase
MRKTAYLLGFLFFIFLMGTRPVGGISSGPLRLASPDGAVQIIFRLTTGQAPTYSVRFRGKSVVEDSPLSLEFRQGGTWGAGQEITSVRRDAHDETYPIVVGKSSQARDHYDQMIVALRETAAPHRKIELQFRAYSDGVAFRYFIPEQDLLGQFEILSERSEFRFPADYTCWAAQYGSFTTSQEREFDRISLDRIQPGAIVGLPLTISLGGTTTVALTEANLRDYAGMYVEGVAGHPHTVVTRLSPPPDGGGVAVRARAPHYTPWRVLMLGGKPGDLIESNIVLNLSDPCALGDTSWIFPGKTVFPWWPHFKAQPPVPSRMTTENQKYYIDFAEEIHARYMEFEPPWYGPEVQAVRDPESLDITKAIPELDMPEILSYGRQHGVGLIIWMHWKALRKQMDEALALYDKWGAKGIKCDFMDSDNQTMVNFYEEVVRKCAQHHLLVDFHGAYKPTGLRRTYPNLITREGVMGAEYNKSSHRATPLHNVTLPFTRMLAGPMDYTPGGFRNVTAEQFTVNHDYPMVMGTRCHQLAMYVVYESPLMMVSDSPEAYRGAVGTDFIRQVPTSWDETRVLAGEVAEYVVIARRLGKDWYIGAMTNWTPRHLVISLAALGSGNWQAEVYKDGPDAARTPTDIAHLQMTLPSSRPLEIDMAPGGGWAAHLRPLGK